MKNPGERQTLKPEKPEVLSEGRLLGGCDLVSERVEKLWAWCCLGAYIATRQPNCFSHNV
jgi:hypothetical protein